MATRAWLLLCVVFCLVGILASNMFRPVPTPSSVITTSQYQKLEFDKKEAETKAALHEEKANQLSQEAETLCGQINTLKAKLAKVKAEKPNEPIDEVPELKAYIEHQNEEIVIQNQLIKKQDEAFAVKSNENDELRKTINEKDVIIMDQTKQIELFKEQEEELISKLKKERWKGRLEGLCFSPVGWLVGKIF